MSSKCNRGLYHSHCNNNNNVKRVSRVIPKRMVMSNKLGNFSEKSCSTGVIKNECGNKPRKTSKSDASFSSKYTGKSLDYCRKCGDTIKTNTSVHTTLNFSSQHRVHSLHSQNFTGPPYQSNINGRISQNGNSKHNFQNHNNVQKNKSRNGGRNGIMKSKENNRSASLKQYYKNDNFKSVESIQETENDFRRLSLDTIKELPETRRPSDNIKTLAEDCNVFEVYSDTEEMGFYDVDDCDNIDNLKKFRDNNYFECHSVKSRVEDKESVGVSSLSNHKCVYRFYLNDRLFPIPLSTDHHDNVRCVECHLPMDLKMDLDQSNKANGTIQAKVKLSGDKDAQDMILFLPVKDSLIIREKRKQMKEDDEVMYFGVIKLDNFGNSVFKSTLPTDSFALKYQKGYREYASNETYNYKGIEKDDVVII